MRKRINPADLTRDLGGKWLRSYGTAPCPCCQPERRRDQNALTISEWGGRLLLNCKKSACDFRDLLAACDIRPGGFELNLEAREHAKRERIEADGKALRCAVNIWQQGRPIAGTPGETYLRKRGSTCDLPGSLRWLPDIFHQPSGRWCSAMVAQVQSVSGEPMGIHRTFFTRQGERLDKATGIKGSHKMMLGPCRGGAVRISEADGQLVVAEGIETVLSLASGLLRKPARIWAALSTSGIAGLDLPPAPGNLTIAQDGDDAGRSAALRLAERASALGWHVSLLPAPDDTDWNDVLMKRGVQ